MDLKWYLFLFQLLLMNRVSGISHLTSDEASKILIKMDKHNHIKNVLPEKPVNVEVSIFIRDMMPVQIIHSHIFLDMSIWERWHDKRLEYNASAGRNLILSGTNTDEIWKPDLWVVDERGGDAEKYPKMQAVAVINPNGTVTYSQRFGVLTYCPMKLSMFPFDHQKCYLALESFGLNRSFLKLHPTAELGKSFVTFSNSFLIKEFLMEKYDVTQSVSDYGPTGVFDQLTVVFHLKRDIRHYILDFFLPIFIVVLLSFMSFWVNYRSTPARVALPVTTFLALTGITDQIRSKVHLIGGTDILEVYLNVSMLFVYGVIVEYGIVGITDRIWSKQENSFLEREDDDVHKTLSDGESDKKNKAVPINQKLRIPENQRHRCNQGFLSPRPCLKDCDGDSKQQKEWFQSLKERYFELRQEVHIIDKLSRIAFPGIYLFFNLVYVIICAVHTGRV